MKVALLVGASMVVLAASAMAAGSNLAWNDCVGGGGVPDRTVACTNTGSGFAYATLNPSQFYPNVTGTEVYLDVAPDRPISSWWNPTPTTTRWGSSKIEPPSGACPAWWAGASLGAAMFPPQATVNFTRNTMRLRIVTVVASGEEQPMEPGAEYFVSALELKSNAGTAGNSECDAGAVIGIALFPTGMGEVSGISVLQPDQPNSYETTADISNCVTFRSSPFNQCALATPTQKSTWGSIKALYR